MSQIQINYKGDYQLDATTRALNPTAIVTSATDNFVNQVSVVCTFQNLSYSYSRSVGTFLYAETWTNEDVIEHLNTWMNERKL